MAYIYVVRCADGSLYTGIASDICRRMREHAAGGKAAAKYTRAHPIRALEALWQVDDLSSAARLEYRIKQLSREQKEHLLRTPSLLGGPPYGPEDEIPCRPLTGVTLEDCLSGKFNPA